ncbi:MAG TPA: hypothetical protein DCY59_05755 [Micrococcaceae bacterium]|jgi:flavin reductase (DIM6/NTAB) family NADH-FMN oxidoreductase RutF|nr:hypothetical protein [Micrococcaceae bacterium]
MSTTNETPSALQIEEHGDPLEDSRAFRRALGQFATGVSVITMNHEGVNIGMAVNSFAAVSLEPALISWSIRNESRNRDNFANGGHFAVNILASDQVETSALFGRPQEGQFDQVPWHEGILGDPLLDNAIAHLECEIDSTVEAGDHLILIGKVKRYARLAGMPLVFAQGQYRVSREHPRLQLTTAAPLSTAVSGDSSNSPLFVSLLRNAEQRMSNMFNSYRERLGLDGTGARVINLLDAGIGTIDGISDEGLMHENTVEDTLRDFLQRGWIIEASEGVYALSAEGIKIRARLLESAIEFNAKRLEGVSEADLEAARRVLNQILVN